MKTVVAALLFQGARLLICQRPMGGDFPGKWEFPGGKMEPDENPRQALRRELQEELGIAAEIGGEAWRVEHQYPGHAPLLLLFFAIPRYQGKIENHAFQQVCWVPTRSLLQYDFLEANRTLVQRLAAGEISLPPCGAASSPKMAGGVRCERKRKRLPDKGETECL